MEILETPIKDVLIIFLITLILTSAVFYPALANFGEVMYGGGDLQFFIWLFEHYAESLENGTNPLFAHEIYYPYGISLTMSTITPLQGAIYLVLPDEWPVFGKITFLQMLSFVIGGIFSFCLVYKFTRSFLPSLLGSFIYNFSAFHFEKMLHHLNYNIGLAFLPLFFFFYYQMLENTSRKNILLLSVSLLLLGLCEMTLAIMAGFIVMLDIFSRYMSYSKRKIFTPKNTPVLGISLVVSLLAFEFLSLSGVQNAIMYTLPSLVFILPFAFIILGKKNLENAEKKYGYFRAMVLAAIPILIWLAFLALQPIYDFKDSVTTNIVANYRQIEYLFFPSNLQAVSEWLPWESLSLNYSMGLYLGPIILGLLLVSYLAKGAGSQEKRFRNWSILLVLFSFPIVIIGSQVVAITPFVVETLFPLLPVLRVPARFIIFSLLFISIFAGILSKRVLLTRGTFGKAILGLLLIIILINTWPALDQFEFNSPTPEFYLEIAKNESVESIFIYPNAGYYRLTEETYYQTLHGKRLSCGILSRFPFSGDESFDELVYMCFMSSFSAENGYTEEGYATAMNVLQKYKYDYIVVQKIGGGSQELFLDASESQGKLELITSKLEADFGKPVYEDDSRIIYANRKEGVN